MKNDFAADHLDVQAFAQAGATVQGEAPLRKFPRLLEETTGEGADRPVHWTAVGEQRMVGGAPQAWLHLEGNTVLSMTCQRCLEPVDMPLSFERSFRFVADEAAAEAEDDLVEEDLLVTRRDFPLQELVEDECLMALPVVPQHEVCPIDVPLSVSDPDFEAANAEKPHPFAALAHLRPGEKK